MLISFEGCDGTGKSTQAKMLYDRIKLKHSNVILVKEPFRDEKEPQLFNALSATNYDIKTRTMIFFALRNELYKKIIIPALDAKTIVICDRGYDSTIVYQGYYGGDSIEDIVNMKIMILKDLDPDCTFWLDCPTNKIFTRINMRKGAIASAIAENISEDDLNRIEKLKLGYNKLAHIFRHRMIKINANKNPEKVHEAIVKSLNERFANLEL